MGGQRKANIAAGMVGRNLTARAGFRGGIILVAAGLAGAGIVAVQALVLPGLDLFPTLSLVLTVLPLSLGYLALVTAAVLRLGEAGKTGVARLVQLVAPLAAAALLLFVLRPVAGWGAVEWRLSDDARTLTIVMAVFGLGIGALGHRRVAVRPLLIALFLPFYASWPDYLGAYVVLTDGWNAVFRLPEIGNTERLAQAEVLAVQASGVIFVQYAAAAGACLAATAAAYLVKRLRRRR